MSWNLTEDDRLDFTDKDKTILFFEDDLRQAERYLKFLDRLKAKGAKIPVRYWALAQADIVTSKKNLALAKKKLGIQ